MTDGVWIAVLGLLVAPVASYITWILNRRKRTTDVSSSLVSASNTAVAAITDVLEELRVELHNAKLEIEELKKINRRLEISVAALTEQNQTLMNERLLANNRAQMVSEKTDSLERHMDNVENKVEDLEGHINDFHNPE